LIVLGNPDEENPPLRSHLDRVIDVIKEHTGIETVIAER
jgi:hypothetical protein